MKPVKRIQQNLLAANERRLLDWLCARMPAWVGPDMLTSVGFVGSLMIFAGYAASPLNVHWMWVSIAGFFINWFGDSLDGSIARYRKIERPEYGYFVDHSIDAFSNMLMVIGFGMTPFLRFDVALFALVGYMLLSIHTFLAARVTGEFNLTYLAAGPTEMRLILISITLGMIYSGTPTEVWQGLSGFDIGTIGLGVILIILFVTHTISTARKLYTPSR